jgi:alkyl hydroperoxide reductase subunit AhpC
MRKIIVIFTLALVLAVFSYADNAMIGKMAPFFKVRSGDNRELSLSDLRGKTIVLFYETKGTKEKNRNLKNELNKFYDRQPEAIKKDIARVAVINCKGVIFTGAWKSALVENSKKEGMAIYGDWTGEMAVAYKMKPNDSNLIIIDSKGVIRYYNSGQINDLNEIKDLLDTLTRR